METRGAAKGGKRSLGMLRGKSKGGIQRLRRGSGTYILMLVEERPT